MYAVINYVLFNDNLYTNIKQRNFTETKLLLFIFLLPVGWLVLQRLHLQYS